MWRQYHWRPYVPIPPADDCPFEDVILAQVQSVELIDFDPEYWFGDNDEHRHSSVGLSGLEWESDALDWFASQPPPQHHHHLRLEVLDHGGCGIGYYDFPQFVIPHENPSQHDSIEVRFVPDQQGVRTAWHHYNQQHWDVWRAGGLEEYNWWRQVPADERQSWYWISKNRCSYTGRVRVKLAMARSPVWNIDCSAVDSVSTFYLALSETLFGPGGCVHPNQLRHASRFLQQLWPDSPKQFFLHGFDSSLFPGGLEALEEALHCSERDLELVLV